MIKIQFDQGDLNNLDCAVIQAMGIVNNGYAKQAYLGLNWKGEPASHDYSSCIFYKFCTFRRYKRGKFVDIHFEPSLMKNSVEFRNAITDSVKKHQHLAFVEK